MHLLPVQTLFDFYRSRVIAPFELLVEQKKNLLQNEDKNKNAKKHWRKRKRGKDDENNKEDNKEVLNRI